MTALLLVTFDGGKERKLRLIKGAHYLTELKNNFIGINTYFLK